MGYWNIAALVSGRSCVQPALGSHVQSGRRRMVSPTRVLAALLLALTLSLVPVVAGASDAVGLPELVRLALATDETVALADSEVRKADFDVHLARSALMPRLSLDGTWTRYQDDLRWDVGEGQSIVIRPLEDWNWNADLTQTLFSGLRDWRARDLATVRAEAARFDRLTSRLDLGVRVAQAFYDLLAARQTVHVRKAAVTQSESQVHVAQRRFEVGEVASADVLRWKARLAEDRRTLVRAQGIERLVARRLARLCGVDPPEKLATPAPVQAPSGSREALIAQAMADRPAVRSLERMLQAAGLMIRIEKGAWYPQLDAHLQYFRQRSTFPSADWLSLSFTAHVPIYDGGLTAARVAKAREDEAQVRLEQRALAKRIGDEVDSARIALETAEASLQAALEGRNAAREAHRQTERAYRAGEATATDLLEASSSLTEAEAAVVLARWQRELQAIGLRRAVGMEPIPNVTLLPDDTRPETEKPEEDR